MQRTDFGAMSCSIARSLHLVGDSWTPLILRDVYLGISRFDDLRDDLGIARNVLAARLAWLVDHGILVRQAYQVRQVRYDYVLSEKGRDLAPVLMALMAWGDRWTAGQDGPPVRLRHEECGELVEPVVVCSHCQLPLVADAVKALPGPGGRIGPGTRLVGQFREAPTR